MQGHLLSPECVSYSLLLSLINQCTTSFCWQEIDFNHESIVLADTSHTEIVDLPMRVPKDSARYHFFLYKHSYEGDYRESIGTMSSLVLISL